jgi:putative DNA methylase
MTYKKKLIEVALPLDAINIASAHEKALRHGHPSTLHQWWSRKPLATARAVIFAQMVDDPSEHTETLLSDPAKKRAATRELNKRLEAWNERKANHDEARRKDDRSVTAPGPEPKLEECVADIERERLFEIIRQLVLWENTTNEKVLQQARDEIWQSWRYTCAENADHTHAKELFDPHKLPRFHDPFAGGGSLPLEAQRLGIEAHASDLNPVAVLINKAMIEIPPKFAGKPAVNPDAQRQIAQMDKSWRGAQGLANDVRYYGNWMRDEAGRRIGHFYPKIEVTKEMAKGRPDLMPYVGKNLTVIAWLWARTVKSPNPAFAQVDVPLASTFMLSTKPGKETYVEPVIEGGGYRFTVKAGTPKDAEASKNGTKLARGANFRCLMSGSPIVGEYIKAEGKAGRMDARLMAIVAEGENCRVYLPPTEAMEAIAHQAKPEWRPETRLPDDARNFWTVNYGLEKFGDLFTARQLVSLTTFCDLIQKARERVERDASAVSKADFANGPTSERNDAGAYANAVAVYLAFAVDKSCVYWNSLCPWLNQPKNEIVGNSFARQALMMAWGYAEANPFSQSGGNISKQLEYVAKALECGAVAQGSGYASQADVSNQSISSAAVISTDPPYYDNIGYADLSDFFYIWLRRSLKPFFPDLFATLAVPKVEE